MSTASTAIDGVGPAAPGISRVLRDTWTITRRDLEHWVAQPAPVVIGLLFPVMTVLMFGYLFGGALSFRAAAATGSSCYPECSRWPWSSAWR